MNPFIGANFTAILSASTVVSFPPALCLCLDASGESYVVADTAAIAASPALRASGVAVSQGGPNGAVTIQYIGEVSAAVTGLGTAGSPSYVRVAADGTLERIGVISLGDQVVGWADTLGNVQVSFAAQSSTLIGTLAGDVTGPPSTTIVERLNGATIPASGALITGNVPQVIGLATLDYGPINLGGGPDYVTGLLPNTNVSPLAGDVQGPLSSTVLAGITGIGGVVINNGAYINYGSGIDIALGVFRFDNSANTSDKGILSITSQDGGNPSRSLLRVSGAGSVDTFLIGESALDAMSLTTKEADLSFVTGGLLLAPTLLAKAFFGTSSSLTGLWLGSAAAMAPDGANFSLGYDGTTLKIRNNAGDITVTGTSIDFFLDVVSFGAGQTPLISQDEITSIGTAVDFTIRAQGNLGIGGTGGNTIIEGSRAPFGMPGRVQLSLYSGRTLVELVPTTSSKRILALVNGTEITTEVTTNSGDKVVYLANAASAPTVNATSGGILYSSASDLTWWGGGISLKDATKQHAFFGPISGPLGGAWFGTDADAPTNLNYSVMSDGSGNLFLRGGLTITMTATSTVSLVTPLVSFSSAQTTPTITQGSAGAAAAPLLIRAQSTVGANTAGGNLILEGGARTGAAGNGAARLGFVSGGVMLEAADLYDAGSKRVVSLMRGSAITSTQMPSGTGDLVMYLGNAATVPTANPASGGILYVDAGALTYRSPGGIVTVLAAA